MSESLVQPPEAPGPKPWPFASRVWRVLRLHPKAFEDIEADSTAVWQAALVVILAGAARGLSAAPVEGVAGIVGSVAVGLVLWVVASLLLALLGRRFFEGTTDLREMLRTIGFAAAPLFFLAPTGLLPGPLHGILSVLIHGWAAVAAVVAVREALDLSTTRALIACALSLGVALALLALLGLA